MLAFILQRKIYVPVDYECQGEHRRNVVVKVLLHTSVSACQVIQEDCSKEAKCPDCSNNGICKNGRCLSSPSVV